MILIRKHCYKARFPNRNRTSISFLIGLFLLYAIFARLCFSQAATSVAAPEVSNTEIRSANALSPKQDVVENRYWHLLTWQNHLDQVAAEREKQGKDGRWLRDYVQNRLGIEADQFAPVHESAQSLTEALQKIDQKVRTLLDEKRSVGDQAHISEPLHSTDVSRLHELTQERQRVIHEEVARLQEEMDIAAFQLLKAKLEGQTGPKPQAYFHRASQSAISSAENETSLKALLQSIVPIAGTIPGTSDERDLMEESCLDDEFNPGDCDLDVGAALAATPDGDDVEAFAFSDMSPDYMGHYNTWPRVEADLFQGGNAVDVRDTDSSEGSATTQVSSPVVIGSIYTDVATPYACRYNRNSVRQCDPLWGGQIGAVEIASAPSISALSPSSAFPGSSGTLTVYGSNLLNIFTPSGQPEVSSSTSSITLSAPTAPSPTSTSVQVNYFIAANAAPGLYDVSASNNWGTSNAAALNVVSGASVQSRNRAKLQPTTTMSQLPQGGCTVASSSDPESSSLLRIVWWASIIGPYPAGDIECQATTVMAGQQINIYIPSFLTINNNWDNVTNITWTIYDCSDSSCTNTSPTVNAVGGYTASSASGKVTSIASVMNQNPILFYFTVPGRNELVNVSGTYNGNVAFSGWVQFYVGGPTGNLLLTPNMITGTGSSDTGVQVLAGPKLSTTGIPVGTKQVGITFKSNATPPYGYNQSFTWVQIIGGIQNQYINSNGTFSTPSSPESGIDNTYPYANASSTATNDTPSSALPSMYGMGAESFTATMFLMWDPALPSDCTPASTNPTTLQSTASTCTSIPIPLSSVTWHWSGCAINTLANQTNGTTWSLSTANGCPVQTLGTVHSAGFPEWTRPVVRSY